MTENLAAMLLGFIFGGWAHLFFAIRCPRCAALDAAAADKLRLEDEERRAEEAMVDMCVQLTPGELTQPKTAEDYCQDELARRGSMPHAIREGRSL